MDVFETYWPLIPFFTAVVSGFLKEVANTRLCVSIFPNKNVSKYRFLSLGINAFQEIRYGMKQGAFNGMVMHNAPQYSEGAQSIDWGCQDI